MKLFIIVLKINQSESEEELLLLLLLLEKPFIFSFGFLCFFNFTPRGPILVLICVECNAHTL